MNDNQSLDRLFRRAARPPDGAGRSGACLDTETLAAWMDHTMRADERAAAEAHVADCGRCLALLRALAQTAPPSEPAAGAWRLPMRWLAPIAAAAVAITTWVIVERGAYPVATVQRETPQSQPVPDTVGPAPSRGPERSAPAEPSEKPKTPPAGPRVLRDSTSSARSESRSSDPGVAPANTAEAEAVAQGKGQAPGALSPTAPSAAPSSGPTTLSRTNAAADAAQSRARFTSDQPLVITSPDRSVQWRVSGTVIHRSVDDGRTWQPQASPQGLALLAGSSPASDVCWIAGRAGVVLVTTDGQTWRRVRFPDPSADLVSVSARDAETVTVTSADGRIFATGDGGRTWTLQEHLPAPF